MRSGLGVLLCCTVGLLLCECGSSHTRPHGHSTATLTAAQSTITPTDGALAVFRAKVTPILCRYMSALRQTEVEITNTANNAGGAINASAPKSTQNEYASDMRNFSNVLHTALAGFRSVTAPPSIAAAYKTYVASLASMTALAGRVARYAAERNYTEIAAMESVSTPAANEGVFHEAGITGCETTSS